VRGRDEGEESKGWCSEETSEGAGSNRPK